MSILLRAKKSRLKQALSILRRFGTNAHVYLPGIGTLSGLQAANYLDSAGTTLATVDSPVGLVLDAMGSVGVELASAAGTWLPPVGATVNTATSSIAFSGSQTDYALCFVGGNLTIGKTYRVEWTVSGRTQGSVQLGFGGNTSNYVNQNGTFTRTMLATTTDSPQVQEAGYDANFIGTVSAISVREVTGIHATQATTASKPILRQTAGKYSWAFDGGDSLALGSVPFVGTDDFAVLSCVHPTIVNSRDFFSIGSTALANPLSRIGVDASNYATFFLRDDAAVSLSITDNVAISTPTVISARKVGAAVVLRTNGTQRGTNSTAIGATTFNSAAIGQRAIATPSSWWTGSTGPILAIKGTLTDSEMLTLERLVSNLTPNGPTF